MVTDMVRYSKVIAVAEKEGLPQEFIRRLRKLETPVLEDKATRKRHTRQPAPEGGISICAAAKKYDIAAQTIHRWVKAEYIPVLKKTDYESFIDEARLAEIVKVYNSDPGHGTWVVKRFIEQQKNNS